MDTAQVPDNVVWYVRPPAGGQYGPADGTLMKQWISENRVPSAAYVWRDGWPQWRLASEVFASELAMTAPSAIDLEADLPSASVADQKQAPVAERPKPKTQPVAEVSTIDASAFDDDLLGTQDANPKSAKHETATERRVRKHRRKRTQMIAVLGGISLLLIVVLIFVLSS
ncbi:MAG: DUF4339 domain-containing protein [Pirellulaceae bacterium]